MIAHVPADFYLRLFLKNDILYIWNSMEEKKEKAGFLFKWK